jgi:hypothetical protein
MKLNIRSLTIFMGAFLALAIVFFQLFHFQVSQHPKKDTPTEQAGKKQSGQEAHYTVLSSFSIPAPACIELDVESFFLFEISFEGETESGFLQEIPHYTSKFLQTLFRVTISPNAP